MNTCALPRCWPKKQLQRDGVCNLKAGCLCSCEKSCPAFAAEHGGLLGCNGIKMLVAQPQTGQAAPHARGGLACRKAGCMRHCLCSCLMKHSVTLSACLHKHLMSARTGPVLNATVDRWDQHRYISHWTTGACCGPCACPSARFCTVTHPPHQTSVMALDSDKLPCINTPQLLLP